MVAFNWADFARFRGEILASANAVVLYEADDPTPREEVEPHLGTTEGSRWIPVPFTKLAKETAGTALAKNIVTLGVMTQLFGLPREGLVQAITRKFSAKKAEVLESNLRGFAAGEEWARDHAQNVADKRLEYTSGEPMLLMSGNELSAVAALHAGCRFFAGYPITPSSEILHFLSEWMPRVGGYLIQTEDELAAIGAVIGGSFAGVKSMTATSGPGLALMTEMLGLAAMAEVPAVIIDVQRGGPSTGLPDQERAVRPLAGAVRDPTATRRGSCSPRPTSRTASTPRSTAFNIAEETQLPVIVLSDQYIAQRKETLSMLTLDHEVVGRQVPTAERARATTSATADTKRASRR